MKWEKNTLLDEESWPYVSLVNKSKIVCEIQAINFSSLFIYVVQESNNKNVIKVNQHVKNKVGTAWSVAVSFLRQELHSVVQAVLKPAPFAGTSKAPFSTH